MNFAAVSGSDGGASMWGVVAAFAGVAVTVLLGLLNWRGAADSLRRAERLGDIAERMDPSPERALVVDMRDRYMVAWILRRLGPRYLILQATFIVGLCFAIVAFVAFAILSSSDQTIRDSWIAYVIAFALMLIAQLSRLFRTELRSKWMAQEKSWRGIETRIADRTELPSNSRFARFFAPSKFFR